MKISILIPCHNEEKSIKKCIESCLNQTRKIDQILVVNDGSTDRSAEILKKFGKKIEVINITPATGNKSRAQEVGLKHITGDILVSTDGDTLIDKNFAHYIAQDFSDPKVAAVGGYVRSLKYNWLTSCRAFDYVIGQDLHKQAQSHLDFMLVIPGAAGAFRTKTFRDHLTFDHDTLTEDLDFTYKLHKKGLKIKYDKRAIVFTQDPTDLDSYINQMRRWYGGGWQNLAKHLNIGLLSHPGRALELSLVYIEGVVFSFLLFLLPALNLVFSIKVLALYWLVMTAQILYAAFREKRPDILQAVFVYPFIMYINAYIFLEQFVKEVILKRKNLIWYHPVRVTI